MAYKELDQFRKQQDKQSMKLFLDSLDTSPFSIEDFGIPSRVLTHWKKMKLLPFGEKKGHLKVNVFELFWMQVIKDLRELGVQLSLINELREEVFTELIGIESFVNADGEINEAVFENEMIPVLTNVEIRKGLETMMEKDPELFQAVMQLKSPLFYGMVLNLLTKNLDTNFLITANGRIELLQELETEEEKKENGKSFLEVLEAMDYQPFITISLRKYLIELIEDKTKYRKIEELEIFEDVEVDVLRAMREGRLKELKIIFDKNKRNIDLVRVYNGKAKMEEISEVMSKFKGQKHVAFQSQSNDGVVMYYEYQKRSRYATDEKE